MRRTIASLAVTGTCLITMVSSANTITFETPSGSTTSGPVDAKAKFVTSTDTLTITLQNLGIDPKDVAQNISAIGFTLTTGQTVGSLTSSSGAERTVHSGGTYTDGAAVAAGWVFSHPASGGLLLDDLVGPGHAGPAHTLIGAPNASNKYGNAMGSIAGNGPHNPFLVGDVTFTLHIAGLTSDSSISSMFFQFGTTDGSDRITVRPPSHGVPDGGTTVALLGGALSTLALVRRKLS